MIYRILNGITHIYPYAALGLFVLLAVIAFAFTVIYPLVPIVLMISSIFLVVFVRCGYLALKWVELKLAMESLSTGSCPACGTRCDALRVGERRIQECPGCRRVFDDKGEPYVPSDASSSEAEQPATFERGAEAAS